MAAWALLLLGFRETWQNSGSVLRVVARAAWPRSSPGPRCPEVQVHTVVRPPVAPVSEAGRGEHARGGGPCQAPAHVGLASPGVPLRHAVCRQVGHRLSLLRPDSMAFPHSCIQQRMRFMCLEKQIPMLGAGSVSHSCAPGDPQGQWQEPSQTFASGCIVWVRGRVLRLWDSLQLGDAHQVSPLSPLPDPQWRGGGCPPPGHTPYRVCGCTPTPRTQSGLRGPGQLCAPPPTTLGT